MAGKFFTKGAALVTKIGNKIFGSSTKTSTDIAKAATKKLITSEDWGIKAPKAIARFLGAVPGAAKRAAGEVGTRVWPKRARAFGQAAGSKLHPLMRSSVVRGGANVLRGVARGVTHPVTAITIGAVGMTAVGMMRGFTSSARDMMYDRYMRDTRYSRNMLQSNVGRASGANRMLNYGGVNGLSNAMHARRHGR